MTVTNWSSPETFFVWSHVQRFIDRIDSTVYRVAIETAQELFLDQAVLDVNP